MVRTLGVLALGGLAPALVAEGGRIGPLDVLSLPPPLLISAGITGLFLMALRAI
jgi:hypothetical protein